jgi:CheY-like chemotaxis protein
MALSTRLTKVVDVSSAAGLHGGSETILVVEDDELVRTYVVAQLTSLGYAALSAGSGAAALALVDAGAHFDLLFTDVIMPGGMNGRVLADEVAKRRPAVKVLYTSGYTENAIVHQGRPPAWLCSTSPIVRLIWHGRSARCWRAYRAPPDQRWKV